jgi:hypothetical protein
MNKCDLLKRAAKPYGIEPQLECVATQTEFCMETVKVDAADVMTTQPDDLYVAYRYIIVISLDKLSKILCNLSYNICYCAISAIDLFCVHLEIYKPVQICVQIFMI